MRNEVPLQKGASWPKISDDRYTPNTFPQLALCPTPAPASALSINTSVFCAGPLLYSRALLGAIQEIQCVYINIRILISGNGGGVVQTMLFRLRNLIQLACGASYTEAMYNSLQAVTMSSEMPPAESEVNLLTWNVLGVKC